MTGRLILASGSPRRRQLLAELGLEFDVRVSGINETPLPNESAKSHTLRLASEKAASVASSLHDSAKVVLAADTSVELDGNILGKPESKEHGLEMLMRLSGRRHLVVTGVALIGDGRMRTLSVETRVEFRALTRDEAAWYWNTGEPLDKAGGYGLQGIGATFVKTLSGSYSNVVGLPLIETLDLLRGFGVPCPGVNAKEFATDVRQSNG